MSDIFLSYASPDRPRAKLLAHALEKHGWTVWWDRHIPAGRSFDEVIEEELERASCVLVLWSAASVKSDWVKEEASEAARRKTLIPVLIEAVMIPLGFRRIQAAVLVDWQGAEPHAAFEQLVRDIAALIGAPSPFPAEAPRPPPLRTPTNEPALVPEDEAGTRPKPAAHRDQRASSGHEQKRSNEDVVTMGTVAPPAVNPGRSPPQRSIDTVANDPSAATTSAQSRQSERLLKVLRRYGKSDPENFHLTPSIPVKKLDMARRSCRLPRSENVLALVDLTHFMKHAKDCVLFGDRAIYHHHSGDRIAFPYASLHDKAIDKGGVNWTLNVGGNTINMSGPSIVLNTWIKLFNDIKAAVASES